VVLDVKFMQWAAGQGLDTAKLKAAKVPIFGKWYFPEIPAGVAMVDLQGGTVRTFAEPMVAGTTLWAPLADLEAAGFWPAASEGARPPAEGPTRPALVPRSLRAATAAVGPAGHARSHPVGTFAILLAYLMVIIGLWLAMYVMLLQRA
jgi:hypothetical protein